MHSFSKRDRSKVKSHDVHVLPLGLRKSASEPSCGGQIAEEGSTLITSLLASQGLVWVANARLSESSCDGGHYDSRLNLGGGSLNLSCDSSTILAVWSSSPQHAHPIGVAVCHRLEGGRIGSLVPHVRKTSPIHVNPRKCKE